MHGNRSPRGAEHRRRINVRAGAAAVLAMGVILKPMCRDENLVDGETLAATSSKTGGMPIVLDARAPNRDEEVVVGGAPVVAIEHGPANEPVGIIDAAGEREPPDRTAPPCASRAIPTGPR